MLDLLDNLPRLRLSDDHLKAFIWVLKECGAHNVPSFAALRAKQKELSKDVDIKTTNHTSSLGNEFFMNGPADLFKLVSAFFCFSRPFAEVSHHTRTLQTPLFAMHLNSTQT